MTRNLINRNGTGMVILLICIAVIAWSAQPLMADGQQVRQLINLNKADVEKLTSLPGIGSAKARAIVSYREENGPFTSTEDLVAVKGFGSRLLDRIREMITVQGK